MFPNWSIRCRAWLAEVVDEIARKNQWQEDWFNDAVAFHLSALSDHAVDHLEFGTFPRDGFAAGACDFEAIGRIFACAKTESSAGSWTRFAAKPSGWISST